MLKLFINTYVKFFFLLTPFFLLSSFLAMTKHLDIPGRRRVAVKVTLAIVAVCVTLLLAGQQIFEVFGITLNSFRIGTGILLFLSSITLVSGSTGTQTVEEGHDISVVPLAIPIAVGPATTGALLVMGVGLGNMGEILVGVSGLLAAIASAGTLLFLSGSIERVVGKQGLVILSKITGLVLAALAAELVMTGVIGFLGR
jgi:multiple antibiotic resistance protein